MKNVKHLNAFFLLWYFSWNFKALAWVNPFLQGKHLTRFSPLLLCSSLWDLKPDACENAFLQVGQMKGFSPEWTLRCSFEVPFWMKDFPHSSHLNGFSPWWNWMCLFRPTWLKLVLSQPSREHGNLFTLPTSWIIFMCFMLVFLVLKKLLFRRKLYITKIAREEDHLVNKANVFFQLVFSQSLSTIITLD